MVGACDGGWNKSGEYCARERPRNRSFDLLFENYTLKLILEEKKKSSLCVTLEKKMSIHTHKLNVTLENFNLKLVVSKNVTPQGKLS